MYIGFVYKGMTAASLVDSLLHVPFGIRGCLYGSRAVCMEAALSETAR
jgi:hypothetical protein